MRSLWPLLLPTLVFGCSSPSFVIQRHSVAPGAIITSTTVTDMKQCSFGCAQVKNCSGFNFLIDAAGQPHCVLVDKTREPADSEKLLPSAVLYAGESVCLNGKNLLSFENKEVFLESKTGEEKSFSFEKWPQRTLKTNESVIQEEKEVGGWEECLRKCQMREGCRSVIYKDSLSICRLSSISMNTVYNTRLHYEYDEESDLYENNHQGTDLSRFDSQCSWMRLKNAGLPNFFDSQDIVEDVEECERLCVRRDLIGDPCRSYTFDVKTKKCLLSLASARLIGKSPLEAHDSRFIHGDLDDCTDFSLHCLENGLELRGSSIRQFTGFVRTKNGRQLICNKAVNATFDFKVKLGFDECGLKRTEEPFPSYSGVVHVKEGSTPLVTIRDKVLQIQCRMHGQMDDMDQLLAVEMKVEEGNRTDRILSDRVIMVPSRSPPQPKYSLKVLSSDGSPADVIRVGDHGWVQITVNKKEIGASFSVSKLEARDLKSGTNLTLLDEEGCVTNREAVEGIWRPSPHEIRFRINYGVFSHQAEIMYCAFAEPCSAHCDPKCNEDLFSEAKEKISSSVVQMARNKRSISARQVELTQDVYAVHGSRVIVLPKINKQMLYVEVSKARDVTASKVSEPSVPMSFVQCLLEEPTCLFSFALASLQFCLVAIFFVVMILYIHQYRRYRNLVEESENETSMTESEHLPAKEESR